MKVAELLNKHRPLELGKLNICVQVNLDNEASKSGIGIEESKEFISNLKQLSMLKVRGLMAIPKATKEYHHQREVFARIRLKFEELKKTFPYLDTLSMGMSDDYKAAILEGTTMIRIGTRIFGKRA